MTNWKKVDAEQLDADLAAVADAIRERGGTTEQLAFPDGFVSAVENVPDYMRMRTDESLTEYTDLTAEKVGTGAFYRSVLVSVSLPEVTLCRTESFAASAQLERVHLPKAKTFGSRVFSDCVKIKELKLPSVEQIYPECFSGCSNLTAVVLPANVATLNVTSAFYSTPFYDSFGGHGRFYVPATSLDAYKSATNWSAFADKFRVLEDYTVDGTTTGALDLDKINAAEV